MSIKCKTQNMPDLEACIAFMTEALESARRKDLSFAELYATMRATSEAMVINTEALCELEHDELYDQLHELLPLIKG